MRWLPRLVGLSVIAGLLAWSFSYSLSELDDLGDGQAERVGDGEPTIDVTASSGNGDTPRYLAFTGGIPSGVYHVADLPSSNDWDFGERGGRTPEAPSISADNPVNRDVVVEDTPYVTGARPEDPADDGDADDEADENVLPSIMPGLYATRFDRSNCEYELRRIMDDNRDHVIGHDHVHQGRLLVTLNEYEPDTFVATESCGEWSPWSPLVDSLTVAGDGDYWVGDLSEGLWDVPAGCLWEKVIGFRGSQLADVESSGVGPASLRVDQFTLGVRVRHCGTTPMTLSDEPLPPRVQIADMEAAKAAAHARPVRVDQELTAREARRIERRYRR